MCFDRFPWWEMCRSVDGGWGLEWRHRFVFVDSSLHGWWPDNYSGLT